METIYFDQLPLSYQLGASHFSSHANRFQGYGLQPYNLFDFSPLPLTSTIDGVLLLAPASNVILPLTSANNGILALTSPTNYCALPLAPRFGDVLPRQTEDLQSISWAQGVLADTPINYSTHSNMSSGVVSSSPIAQAMTAVRSMLFPGELKPSCIQGSCLNTLTVFVGNKVCSACQDFCAVSEVW